MKTSKYFFIALVALGITVSACGKKEETPATDQPAAGQAAPAATADTNKPAAAASTTTPAAPAAADSGKMAAPAAAPAAKDTAKH